VRSVSGPGGAKSTRATVALSSGPPRGRQAVAGREAGGYSGETPLGVVPVLLQVPQKECLDDRAIVGVELAPVDQPVLQRERSEEGPGPPCTGRVVPAIGIYRG
jgi:hypothetical protein